MEDSRLDKIEQTVDAIHLAVVRIETEHGAKFEALFDGFDNVNNRLDNLTAGQAKLEKRQDKLEQGQAKLDQGQAKLEQGQAKLEQGQADMCVEIRAINRTLGRSPGWPQLDSME